MGTRIKPDRSAYLFTNKMLLVLILPMLAEQAVNLTVGLMDSIMVASVGEAAVSGVSLMDNIFVLILSVFSALSTGGAVIAGQYLGQKNPKKSKEAATELVWVMMLFSIFITVLLYIIKPFILNVVFGKIDADVYSNAEIYFMIVNLSVPFMGLYNACAAVLRTVGNSKLVLITSAVMGLVNIFGNAIGIYVLRAGMAGVAVPTLIARTIGGIGMLIFLMVNKDLTIDRSLKHRFNTKTIGSILRIGIPNGLENGLFQLGKILLLSIISSFGTIAITANAVTNSLAGIQVIPGFAMSLGIMTVVSRCVGAGDYEQARYYTKKLMAIAYISMFIVDIALYLVLPFILKLYQLSPETEALATQLMTLHTVAAISIWLPAFSLPNTFRAAGDAKFAMIISIVAMCVLRIGLGYLLSTVYELGVLGVFIAMFSDWAFRTVVFTIHYIRGKWTTFKAI